MSDDDPAISMPIEKRPNPVLPAARQPKPLRAKASSASNDTAPSSFAAAPPNPRKFESFNSAPPGNSTVDRRNLGLGATSGASYVSKHRQGQGRSANKLNYFGHDQRARGDPNLELGSLSRPGPRKGNIEVIKSRDVTDKAGYRNYRKEYDFPARRRYNSIFSKERYLQANCQFVVTGGEDYSVHTADPDLLVDWDNIEEIRMFGDEVASCPICLYPPTAAKMTRCGHVYCHPCILHYLALSDHEWRKCPICNDAVYAKNLKSVRCIEVGKISVGSEITMTLMRCKRGSTIALPKSEWSTDDGAQSHIIEHLSDKTNKYAKMIIASVDEIRTFIIDRERRELEAKWAVDKNEPEICFVTQALDAVNQRQLMLAQRRQLPLARQQSSKKIPPVSPTVCDQNTAQTIVKYADAFNDLVLEDEKSDGDDVCEQAIGAENPSPEPDLVSPATPFKQHSPGQNTPTARYFYQADDGQQVYLHPLNARCLVHEYGALEAAPATLTGRVLALERVTMDADVRMRYRYLSHTPLSTSFSLAELRLHPDVLSRATLAAFADEIAQRKRMKQRKAKEDKRLQYKAEQLDRAMLLDPSHYASHVESVQNGMTPEIPVLHHVRSAQRDIDAMTGPVAPLPDDNDGGGPTFAQMLRSKPKTTCPERVPASSSQNSGAPDGETATGGGDEEESLPPPAFNNTFGDAILAALHTTNKAKKNKKKKRVTPADFLGEDL